MKFLAQHKVFSSCLAASLIILGCNARMDTPLVVNPTPTKSDGTNTPQGKKDSTHEPSQDAIISYELVKSTALFSCLKCHTEKGDPNLSTMSDLQKHKATVIDEIETNSMPPSDSGYKTLSNCNKAVLKVWLDQGSPETTNIQVNSLDECKTSQTPTPPVVQPPAQQPPVTQPITSEPHQNDLISYTLLKQTSLSTCLNCHSGKIKPNLSSVDGLQKNKSKLLDEVTKDKMPPVKKGYSPLSKCSKAILKLWLDQGSPETTDIKVGSIDDCKSTDNKEDSTAPVTPEKPPTTPLEPPVITPEPPAAVTPILLMPLNYQTLKTQILEPKCLKCHSEKENKEDENILFTSYKALTAASEWNAPAEKSVVYDEISDESDGMPPAEDSTPRLTPDEIEFVKKWIDAGKPEN